jgi:glycerol-3-phosphate dehydrogenase
MELNWLIFGGGVSGLWLLDETLRHGDSALLVEPYQLGHGQTVGSQGIIHGGFKYVFGGWRKLLQPVDPIREMPRIWKECLSGQRQPDLSETRLRATECHIWWTSKLAGSVGLLGTRFLLHASPQRIRREFYPDPLKECRGTVAVLPEPVIATDSLIAELSRRHRNHILKINPKNGAEFLLRSAGRVDRIRLFGNDDRADTLEVAPRHVVFTAGEGNEALREQVGLPPHRMQRRPLQMVMVRGNLPVLNGHCADGGHPRVTITSDTDSAGRTVWQVGGQLAEEAVKMNETEAIKYAYSELNAVLPGVRFDDAEWSTYRINRAEALTKNGHRPRDVQVFREGNVITAWPTKLVFAPRLAEKVLSLCSEPSGNSSVDMSIFETWERPAGANPPWECEREWRRLSDVV